MAAQSFRDPIAAIAPEIATLLERVSKHLDEGLPQKALDVIAQAKSNSPFLLNAAGVCQIRLGNAQRALDVFRNLALGPGGIVLRPDAPITFKTNYATALLATDNLPGCLSILDDLRNENHPAVQKLQDTVTRWKQGLTLWQRVQWHLGGQPSHAPVLPSPPGDL